MLLYIRIIIHLIHLLLQAFSLGPILLCYGGAAHLSTIRAWTWSLHHILECGIASSRCVSMQTSSAMGSDDFAMFQHGNTAFPKYGTEANSFIAHFLDYILHN